MHKKIKISILVMLLILLCTLFNGCINHIKTISVNNKDYFNALKCDNDEYNLVISESSAVDNLNNGYAAQADELLAKSLMDSGRHYYWYPHYITTIVIAVDTGKVKENINSFNSLAGVEEKIYIDSDYYNYITASIGYSLKKENYRLDDAINYLKEMEKDDWKPTKKIIDFMKKFGSQKTSILVRAWRYFSYIKHLFTFQ